MTSLNRDNKKPPQKPGNSSALRDEIINLASNVSEDLAHAIPENNFWGFASYTILAPEILSHITSFALPQPGELGPSWNYIDAACQGIIGLQQLFDSTTHRPLVTKTKGLLNIASNIQAIVLTSLGASLGPIGLAAGFGVGFTLSCDDSIRNMRRLYSPEYFVVDSLAQLDKTVELIQKNRLELWNLEKLAETNKPDKLTKFLLKSKKQSLNNLEEKRDKLKWQIEVKMDIDRFENKKPFEESTLEKIIQKYSPTQMNTVDGREYLSSLKTRPTPNKEEYKKALANQDAIKKESKLDFINSMSNTFLFGMAFTGVLLACIPGMQIAAAAVIAAAATIYLLKNSKQLAEKAQKIYGFFKKDAQQDEGEGEGQIEMVELKHRGSH